MSGIYLRLWLCYEESLVFVDMFREVWTNAE